MSEGMGPQLFHGAEPIFVRRSGWAASGFPEFMREGCDLMVSECDDAMSRRSRTSMFIILGRVLDLLPGLLAPRQVTLLSMLLANTMGMCGDLV